MIQRYVDLSEISGKKCFASGEPSSLVGHHGDIVEVPLLLPSWQVQALETAAHDAGLTAGEMVRHLLRDFIARMPCADQQFHRSEVPSM